MADNNTIARPYAQAIFDLAQEKNELELWSQGLSEATKALNDGSLIEFLSQPALLNKQKYEFISQLFNDISGDTMIFAGNNKQGSNCLKLLIENGRVSVLPEIAEHFNTLKSNIENSVHVTVTSAVPLDEEKKSAIKAALKKRFDRDIHMHTEIDGTLVGGAIIRAGDVVIDGSLRASLDGLTNAMIS